MFIILTLSPPYITLNNSKFIHQYWISIVFSTQRNEKMTKDWLKLLYLLTKCKYFKISITFAEKWSSRLIQILEQCWILIINIYQLNTCRSFNNTFYKISTEYSSCANRHVVVWMFEPDSVLTINYKKKYFSNWNSVNWQKQLRLQCVIKNKLFCNPKAFWVSTYHLKSSKYAFKWHRFSKK